MSIEDVLRRLQEDKLIAERECRQSRISRAFESARQPVETPSTKVEAEIVCEMIVEGAVAAARPPLSPLVDRASPLLEKLAKTPMLRRRPDRNVWTIDDELAETPEELFRSALSSLGYAETDAGRTPMTEEIVSKKGWWRK
jgi:hypothetical protein